MILFFFLGLIEMGGSSGPWQYLVARVEVIATMFSELFDRGGAPQSWAGILILLGSAVS